MRSIKSNNRFHPLKTSLFKPYALSVLSLVLSYPWSNKLNRTISYQAWLVGSPSKAPYEYPTIPYECHLSSSLLTTQDISLKLKCLKWWKPRDRDHPCILSVLLGAIFISSWIFRPSRCSVIIVVSHVSTFCVRPLLSPGADVYPQMLQWVRTAAMNMQMYEKMSSQSLCLNSKYQQ